MARRSIGRRPRRQFDDDFKEGAVRLVLDESKTVAAVARELDLTASALGGWVRHARAERTSGGADRGDHAARKWAWHLSEHLVMAAHAFPLTVKLLLCRDGFYELSDRDTVFCLTPSRAAVRRARVKPSQAWLTARPVYSETEADQQDPYAKTLELGSGLPISYLPKTQQD